MDRFLEDWVGKEVKPVHADWLEKKVSNDIFDGLGAENSIEQMIWDIENVSIRNVLMNTLKENLRTREELRKEISIYYEEIEPRLWDNDLNKLFNLLVANGKRILPSFILKEFEYRDQILAESDPKVRELMEISLKHDKFPSLVLNGGEFYKKFAEAEDKGSKDIILYYLQNWLSPRLVNDEYEDYLDIKNYEYKNEDLKNFLLSLIDERKASPSIISLYFDIIKDNTEFWDAQKTYIMRLINN